MVALCSDSVRDTEGILVIGAEQFGRQAFLPLPFVPFRFAVCFTQVARNPPTFLNLFKV